MANKHETLSALFSAIANAIRGKTGTSDSIVADDFPSAIDNIETGVKLPELTNPATAENIQSGYEAVDGDGNVVTGTATITTYTVEHITAIPNGADTVVYLTNQKRNKCYVYGSCFDNNVYGGIVRKSSTYSASVRSGGFLRLSSTTDFKREDFSLALTLPFKGETEYPFMGCVIDED